MSDLDFSKAAEFANKLISNITLAFIGKDEVVAQAVAAMLAEGHILLEDVPGVGKTLLAKAIAKSISGDLKRIQFTADLLPSDVMGVTVFRQNTGEFEFREGPVFCNVLLGDEINRATPRTQSSLLEAMEETQVSVDGVLHVIKEPFFVIATQNPIELEGTYPLPFSQMDRFMTRLAVGYLTHDQEKRMVEERKTIDPLDNLEAVLTCEDLLSIQEKVRNIRVTDELLDYLIKIVRQTRESENIQFGSSPRGSLDLTRYSQALALIAGRDYVLPDDIKTAAPLVLGHRVIVKKGSRLASASDDDDIKALVEAIEVPV